MGMGFHPTNDSYHDSKCETFIWIFGFAFESLRVGATGLTEIA